MNNTLSKVFIFTAGVVVGSVVTWKLVENKYKKIAQEEIDSVKEAFSRKPSEAVEEQPNDDIYGEDEVVVTEEEKEECEEIIRKSSYVSYSDKKEVVNMEKPYIISPEEYEEGDYSKESLDYYEGDGVLVDAFGDIVDDVDGMVGEDFASHFGEYEQDTVYVRNDETEIDYEILRDYRSYSEI